MDRLAPIARRCPLTTHRRSASLIAAAWAALALSIAAPAHAAASEATTDGTQPTGRFSAAAEFIDADWFDDHYAAINALASQGALDGTQCGPAEFCHDESISRGHMAVWLVRYFDGGDPDGMDEPRFADIDGGQWWAPHVERLAQLGITNGCKTDRFCGDQPVTRAQMASFLARGLGLEPVESTGLDDLGDNVHAADIDRVVAAGIVEECSPGRFCPDESVTRGQAASLLDRARNWLPADFDWRSGRTVRLTTVDIPDANLRAIIERAIGESWGSRITSTKVRELRTLNAGYAEIQDLTGLEHFVGLRTLNLTHNNVTDLTPIATLKSLRTLNLDGNPVSDIAPLVNLRRLHTLSMVSDEVVDGTPLAQLTNLRRLYLHANHLESAEPLAALTKLETLDLASSDIDDVTPLAKLRSLRTLSMPSNLVTDLAPLARLENLRTLGLSDNAVDDVSPLADLAGLETLMLNENPIADISSLAGLAGLRTLTMDDARVADASPLAGLTALETLWLRDNAIRDATPFASLTNLRRLDLAGNAVTDVTPLAGLTGLDQLWLQGNRLESVAPLGGLTGLRTL